MKTIKLNFSQWTIMGLILKSDNLCDLIDTIVKACQCKINLKYANVVTLYVKRFMLTVVSWYCCWLVVFEWHSLSHWHSMDNSMTNNSKIRLSLKATLRASLPVSLPLLLCLPLFHSVCVCVWALGQQCGCDCWQPLEFTR